MAERTLGEEDPERATKARTIVASVPHASDIEDYVNQLQSDKRQAKAAREAAAATARAPSDDLAVDDAPLDDSDLEALLQATETENEQAIAGSEAETHERRMRDQQQIASLGARVREAAESWDGGPEVGIDYYQDAVARARIARGESPTGVDTDLGGGIYEPQDQVAGDDSLYGGGDGRERTAAPPPAQGGGLASLPSAGAARGAGDFATCMRFCMQAVSGAEWSAVNRSRMQSHCEFQCRTATSGQPIDHYQHCIESIRRVNPDALASAEARAQVEATCRQSAAAAR